MPSCLLALGSNVGDREAILSSALAALEAAPSIRLRRHSRWYPSLPVGMAGSRREFLNGAAVIDTDLEPLALLEELKRIEAEHGREPGELWADRPLDLDLLLMGDRVVETTALTVPHPRMSFRRFVLEPAAEIAGDFVHPILGWSVGQLRVYLDAGADLVAFVSPNEPALRELVAVLCDRFKLQITDPPNVKQLDRLWPAALTTWLLPASGTSSSARDAGTATSVGSSYPAARQPKLSILWDGSLEGQPGRDNETPWEVIVRQAGRGPTLHVRPSDPERAVRETAAAIEAVWPHLGP